MKTNKS